MGSSKKELTIILERFRKAFSETLDYDSTLTSDCIDEIVAELDGRGMSDESIDVGRYFWTDGEEYVRNVEAYHEDYDPVDHVGNI